MELIGKIQVCPSVQKVYSHWHTDIVIKMTALCSVLVIALSCQGEGPPTSIEGNGGFRVTDFQPAWSPDGTTIAYVHGDTAISQTGIWLIDASAAHNRLLYPSVGANSPSWSRDGHWIAFSDAGHICKMKTDGDSLVQLTFEGRSFFPTWNADGEWIAYDSDNQSPNGMNFIWKMKADGSQKTRIAYDPDMGEIRMPNWSKDGTKIVHIRYLVGVFSSEIFTMAIDGTHQVRLTRDNSTDSFPKYSADGSKIAFTSQPQGESPEICLMRSDGTELKRVTATQGYTCDWSPDGAWIVYTDSRSVSGRLWLIRVDGSGNHQLSY